MFERDERASRTRGGTTRRASFAVLLDRSLKYWALLPAALLLLLLTVHPSLNLIRMSASEITFEGGRIVWRYGLDANIALLQRDWVFGVALRNTLVFVVATVILEMAFGFALALLVSRLPVGAGIIRTIMVLPILVPPIAIGSMWKLMYNFEFGVFNQALKWVGLQPLDWLGSRSLALASVIAVDVWQWTPFVFLILLAGIEALPISVLEAARVDGANLRQMVVRVIIPLMWPAISVALVFRTIFSFKVFDKLYLLTSGGPGTSTEVISLYIYKVFFAQNRLGYGAMLSLISIGVIAALVLSYRLIDVRKTA
jgi:multiple sugar transport system permease protein